MQVYSQKSTRTTLPLSMAGVSGAAFTQRSTVKVGMSPAALAAPAPTDRTNRRRRFLRSYMMTLGVAAIVIVTVARNLRRPVFIRRLPFQSLSFWIDAINSFVERIAWA